MKCSGLILAAGASSRMGRPKALLPFEGESFIDRLIGVFASDCSEVIVVLGYHSEAIRPSLRRSATIAINPEPERGQLSSMQCGLRLLSDEADAFLFTPVDYPAIDAPTVQALIRAMSLDSDSLLAIPRHEGRHGHPVACRASLAAEFLELPPDAQARIVVQRHRSRTVYVDVCDPGTITDIDDPESYEQLLRSRI